MKVSINGYGSIGKRVADAVNLHDKLELVGVSKYTPDEYTKLANISGIKIFSDENFSGKAGTVSEMIDQSDIIVDAAPKKIGAKNNEELYKPKGKPVILQGGENDDACDISFNSRSNFDEAKGKQAIRVVSCNTTGYCRLIKPLSEKYDVSSVNGILIRRATDPNDKKGGPINSVQWEANSHHGRDVNTILDSPKVTSTAFLVPHTLSHVNSAIIKFNGEVPSKNDIHELFSKENRIAVLQTATSTSQVIEIARDLGLKRYDTYMPSLLLNTYSANENEIFISFMVPQESIVVPENVDAIVAQSGLMNQNESIEYTNKILGMDKIKQNLEEIFS